jgi:hypothetical protein
MINFKLMGKKITKKQFVQIIKLFTMMLFSFWFFAPLTIKVMPNSFKAIQTYYIICKDEYPP